MGLGSCLRSERFAANARHHITPIRRGGWSGGAVTWVKLSILRYVPFWVSIHILFGDYAY